MLMYYCKESAAILYLKTLLSLKSLKLIGTPLDASALGRKGMSLLPFQIIINLLWTCRKLFLKEEPYRLSTLRSLATDKHKDVNNDNVFPSVRPIEA